MNLMKLNFCICYYTSTPKSFYCFVSINFEWWVVTNLVILKVQDIILQQKEIVICFLLSNSNPNQTANKWLIYIIIIITWSKEPDHDKLPEADQQINLDFSRLLDLMFCAWQRDVIRPFGLSYYDIQDPLIIRKIYQNLHCLPFKLNLFFGGGLF